MRRPGSRGNRGVQASAADSPARMTMTSAGGTTHFATMFHRNFRPDRSLILK